MKLFRYLLLVVSSFVFISINGCVASKSPYDRPPEWFKPEKQQESCPDLSGIYDNMSVLESELQNTLSLFTRLIPRFSTTFAFCYDCTVDIRWLDSEQDTLSVTIADATGKLETTSGQLKKSSGDFRCENGALIIDYTRAFEVIFFGGFTTGTNKFYRGTDGSVMCESNYSSFAHYFYFVPIFYSAIDQTNFLRWGQYAPVPLIKKLTNYEKLGVIISYAEKALANNMLQESSRSEPSEFVNILNESAGMLRKGNTTEACASLNTAYKLSDGSELPPDLVEGQLREGISNQIFFLMLSLKCQREIAPE